MDQRFDIDQLTLEELYSINRLVVDRIHELRQSEIQRELAKFKVGDRVTFRTSSALLEGIIVRLNKKTISVQVNDQQTWKVSPKFLMKADSKSEYRSNVIPLRPI